MTTSAQHTPTTPVALVPDMGAPEKNLMNILGNLENLSHLYREELDALELRDMQKFSALQPEKVRLVQDCEQRLTDVAAHSDTYKTLDASLKDKVIAAQSSLEHLVQQSQRACLVRAESARRVQNRLIAVARSIMEENQRNYTAKGAKKDLSKIKPIATAINEAI